jgi:hypothetical protein
VRHGHSLRVRALLLLRFINLQKSAKSVRIDSKKDLALHSMALLQQRTWRTHTLQLRTQLSLNSNMPGLSEGPDDCERR